MATRTDLSAVREEGLPRGELPALTSIRALLAWWIVAYHALPMPPFGFGSDVVWLKHGPMGVDCFFVLSGFVLCHVHPTVIGAKTPHPVKDFLVSRLARIYPLHLVMLFAFLCVVLLYRHGHLGAQAAHGAFSADTASSFLQHLFLLNGWLYRDQTAWNVPSWSISSEWAAYLLAPLIFLWMSRLSRIACLVMIGLVTSLVLFLTGTGIMAHNLMLLPQVLTEFILGALLRTLLRTHCRPLLRVRGAALLLGWAFAAVLVFTTRSAPLLAAALWVIFFLSLRTRRATGWFGRLETVTIYLGETSFAVYITHAFLLMLWGGQIEPHLRHLWEAQPILAAAFLVVVIQAFASLLHHLVELPAQRRLRRTFRVWAVARTEGVPASIQQARSI